MSNSNDIINAAIREARGEQLDLSDHDAVNRALRAAGGRDPGPAPVVTRSPVTRFTSAEYAVRHTEPAPGSVPLPYWKKWAWQMAAGLLDEHGRLPGEPSYDAGSNGRTDPDGYDATGAVAARLRRWEAQA